MRAKVLNDPALAKHAGRFVWLSVNAEDSRNAEFVERVGISGYPTFLIMDAAMQVVLRWYGSLTVAQVEQLLHDGEQFVAAVGGAAAEQALARAARLNGAGKAAEAAEAYAEAVRAGPRDGDRRARAVESLILALQAADELERCASTAREEAPSLERGPSFANAASAGFLCAAAAAQDAPWRAAALEALEPLVRESLTLDNVLADDRSSYYGILVDELESRGDADGAKQLAEAWFGFLEDESKKTTDAEARAAFDSHRVSAALALGDPQRAVLALLASERDLPQDYNPPARLAVLYRELGQFDAALAASERALDRAYGPRKLRLYDTRADIFLKSGDRQAAKRTLEEALRFAGTLPASQRPKGFLEQIEKKLADLATDEGTRSEGAPST